jgi:hypothetical protein
MKKRILFVSALSVLLTAGALRAEDCPDQSPEDGTARRALAKKWFSQGQTAADAGADVTAIKAYQCSLKFVAHGFTAYNLAQIAERVGDLEVAISSYDQYLQLVPEAKDAQEVNARVGVLKLRLSKARQEAEAGPESKLPLVSSSPASHVAPASSAHATLSESVKGTSSSTNSHRTVAWVVYGGAGAVLVGGLVTNLLARNKMDTCRSTYLKVDRAAAEPSCNDAKPLAYLSYSLFGVGAAAVAVGTVLVLHPTDSSEVALNVLPQGGLTLGWSGTY